MHTQTFSVVAICLTTLLSVFGTGCSTFTSPARDHSLDTSSASKTHWVDFSAERRGAWISTTNGVTKVCAEPFPDVGLNSEISASIKNATATLEGEGKQTVVELKGRSSSVLALREGLYRICELNLSGQLDKDSTFKLFERTLNTLRDLAEAEKTEATTKAKETQTRIEMLQRQPR